MNASAARALQRAAAAGELPVEMLAALDKADPSWRQDPSERRWWDTYRSYRGWVEAHEGAHPTSTDRSAAGLHAWLSSQEDQNLTRAQRTALRHIPGWSRTAGDPDWDRARGVIAALLASGATVADQDVRPQLLVSVTSTPDEAVEVPTEKRRQLLTVLTFAVQTGRLPEHTEPGSRWRKHCDDEVRAALPVSVTGRPRLTVQQHLERRRALQALEADHLPHDETALRAENTWHRRHMSLARRGLLAAGDNEALLAD